jgi:hypothetical protein
MPDLFDQISVNVTTCAVAYPKLDGFQLDMERVYSSAERFLPHCGGSLELAVRHAIHQQLAAHQGARQLFAGLR